MDELKHIPKSVWIVVAVIVVVVLALIARSSSPGGVPNASTAAVDPTQAATDQAAISANADVMGATLAAKSSAFGTLAALLGGVQIAEVQGATNTNLAALEVNGMDAQSMINANERAVEAGYNYQGRVADDQAATAAAGFQLTSALASTESGRQVGLAQIAGNTTTSLAQTQAGTDQAGINASTARDLAATQAAINADNNRTQLAINETNNTTQRKSTTASTNAGIWGALAGALPFILPAIF